MSVEDKDKVRQAVQERYAAVASGLGCGCGQGCCGSELIDIADVTRELGYSNQEARTAPEGANLGLGCGNPQAIAALKSGERVLDLGCGAGFDAFLAAGRVGPQGWVIGVDMTPEMVAKAHQNALRAGYENVEFRQGEIENPPLEDESVDVIISNCVINLSTDKPRVYQEAFRVLAPGGRLAVSDVVALGPLPEEVRQDLNLVSACIGGAAQVAELEGIMAEAGFEEIEITPRPLSQDLARLWTGGSLADGLIAPATIKATKPTRG